MTRRQLEPTSGARGRSALVAAMLLLAAGCGTNEPSRILGGVRVVPIPDAGNGQPATDAGMSSASFTPLCSDVPLTAAGAAPTKNGVCTPTDPQLCYKGCGPSSIGFKSETCSSGSYVEMAGCTFPSGDYSCYKIPKTIDPSCPSTPPQASQSCAAAECAPCNAGGNYYDSQGSMKSGYCVCTPPNDDGMRQWTCGSSSAWPCPGGAGC